MKKKLVLAGVAIVVMLGALFAYRYYYLLTRNVVESLIARKRMIGILVAGSNTFNNNRHRFCGVISVNPENGMVGFTFLPPDLKVDMNGRGTSFRKLREIDISDFDDIRDSLQRDLKLNVSFFIELYAVDIERFIDLIHGIDMFVLDQLPPGDGYGFGLNYFDGKKILRYINDVPTKSIFKKYDRVQDVVLSLHGNREAYRRLLNPEFVSEMLKSFKTNIMPQEIYSLGKLLMDNSEIRCTMLPGEFDDGGNYVMDNISYKIYEKEFLTPLVVEEENLGSIKVKLLNGTDIPGLARKMRNMLIREGLTVVEFGTSPYPRLDHSILINQRGNLSNARKVSEITGIKKIYHVIDNTQLHDVLIILGRDSTKGEEAGDN
ncbi:MAG: LCP family protein [Spirochaetes bacterium]|nr:LCP family protein [Spirochaetota bacterium]